MRVKLRIKISNEVDMICDDCKTIIRFEVVPCHGNASKQVKTECDCGGLLRPITKDGIKCPNGLYTVKKVVGHDDEAVVKMSNYSTLCEHSSPNFGSFVDLEVVFLIIKLVKREDEDTYFSYAEAYLAYEKIKKEIAEQFA